jgi:hypothetical protein
MFEEEICDAIYVSNLHIRAGEKVALLITFLDSYSDVRLYTDEFVGLLSDDTHDVTLFTLNTELSNSSGKVPLLVWRNRRADY